MSNDDLMEELYEEQDDLQPMLEQDEDYIHGMALLRWTGPSDLPEEENRKWFLLIMTASVIIILISLIAHKGMLALILVGVAWLSLMIRRLPSQDIEYVVTSTGFFVQDKFIPWSELSGFWIIKDHGHYILGLDTTRRVFASNMILLGNQNPLEVKNVMSQYIPFKEDRTRDFLNVWVEKAAAWIDDLYMGIFNKSKKVWSNQKARSADKKANIISDSSDQASDPSSADKKSKKDKAKKEE